MRVQKRKVDVKRHTLSYLVGGKWRTRSETAQLAKMGKIEGVSYCRGKYGSYIQSRPGTVRLYSLPTRLEV